MVTDPLYNKTDIESLHDISTKQRENLSRKSIFTVITITVNNVSCSDEGVFRVAAVLGDELVIAQTAITIHR
jgi:hypothetical protein